MLLLSTEVCVATSPYTDPNLIALGLKLTLPVKLAMTNNDLSPGQNPICRDEPEI